MLSANSSKPASRHFFRHETSPRRKQILRIEAISCGRVTRSFDELAIKTTLRGFKPRKLRKDENKKSTPRAGANFQHDE